MADERLEDPIAPIPEPIREPILAIARALAKQAASEYLMGTQPVFDPSRRDPQQSVCGNAADQTCHGYGNAVYLPHDD